MRAIGRNFAQSMRPLPEATRAPKSARQYVLIRALEPPRAAVRWDAGRSTPERSAMFWKVRSTLCGALSANDDAAALSRREMLAGIGLVGVCAVAGPAILGSNPAEAREGTLVAEPISDATQTKAAEGNAAERNSDTDELTEFSSQDWRRRRRRRRRVVCRRRWRRGRVVRVCRRVWY